MDGLAQLGKNTIWLLAARLGVPAVLALFSVILARRLGSTGFGEFAFLTAVIFLGNSLTTFGTDMLLIREIASRDDFSHLPAALVLQFVLSGLFIAGVFFAAPFFPVQNPEAVQTYGLTLLPLSFFTVCTTALRGRQRMGAYALLNLATVFLQTVAAWLFIKPESNILSVAVLLLIVQVITAFLAGITCIIEIPGFGLGWKISWSGMITLARASSLLALLGALGILYQRLAVYMLPLYCGMLATGLYSASGRIVEATKSAHLAAFSALYPAMAKARAGSPQNTQLVKSFRLVWRVLLCGSVIAAAILSRSAAALVDLLYGAEFSGSVPALKILAWIIVPYTINPYLTLALLAGREDLLVMVALLVSLAILAALNMILIQTFGVRGACLAAVLAKTSRIVVYLFPRHCSRNPIKTLFTDI